MEGFGVIDLRRLHYYKKSFSYFAEQLSYPKEVQLPDVDEWFSFADPAYRNVKKFAEEIKKFNLSELQELYVETFDFNDKATLYMTYYKFKDTRERGQLLAVLKTFYEMYGLKMDDYELSDYLPLMCEFLSVIDWEGNERTVENIGVLFSVIEDGTYHLFNALKETDNPYAYLVRGLRDTFKDCIVQEALNG